MYFTTLSSVFLLMIIIISHVFLSFHSMGLSIQFYLLHSCSDPLLAITQSLLQLQVDFQIKTRDTTILCYSYSEGQRREDCTTHLQYCINYFLKFTSHLMITFYFSSHAMEKARVNYEKIHSPM